MAFYLVQHGKCLPKEVDPDRGLSEEGNEEVTRIANVAKGYGVNVSCIMQSGKKRALQTAEIIASALSPEDGVIEGEGLKPLDDVVAVAGTINPADNLMIVGHLPFMDRLTSHLVTGDVDQSVFRFQNGGIVALDVDKETGSWIIIWTLMPNIG